MNARQKLNGAAITGALVFGALFGLATESWVIFIIVVVIFLGMAFSDNSIRLDPHGKDGKTRTPRSRQSGTQNGRN